MKELIVFAAGSALYPLIEIVWRGYTHYSMAIAGGISLCLIDKLCCEKLRNCHMAAKCAAGSGIITSVEFIVGLIVNKIFALHVWDYSAMPLNILGQICLPFSVIWFFITIPAVILCSRIETLVKKFTLRNVTNR